jgi:Flp pilus assembly pilin Flp
VNFHLIVVALTVIIVGGAGSWLGALIGSVFITWLPTVLSFVSEWEGVIHGVLVALVAVFLPGGVLGVIKSLIRRLRRSGTRRQGEGTSPAAQPAPSSPEPAQDPVPTAGGLS